MRSPGIRKTIAWIWSAYMTNSAELVTQIISALDAVFTTTYPREGSANDKYPTTGIKEALGQLGRKLGFRVGASGGDEKEWLYDMGWYTYERGMGGFLTKQTMVLESESSKDREIDGDFMKLVQARADIRIWIFSAKNSEGVNSYIQRCKEQVRRFQGSQPGDRYILAGFDFADHRLITEIHVAP